MSDRAFVSVRREGPLLIVTIERPQVMNALHAPAHHEMAAIFDAFADNDGLWVAIVIGAGRSRFLRGQ